MTSISSRFGWRFNPNFSGDRNMGKAGIRKKAWNTEKDGNTETHGRTRKKDEFSPGQRVIETPLSHDSLSVSFRVIPCVSVFQAFSVFRFSVFPAGHFLAFAILSAILRIVSLTFLLLATTRKSVMISRFSIGRPTSSGVRGLLHRFFITE